MLHVTHWQQEQQLTTCSCCASQYASGLTWHRDRKEAVKERERESVCACVLLPAGCDCKINLSDSLVNEVGRWM